MSALRAYVHGGGGNGSSSFSCPEHGPERPAKSCTNASISRPDFKRRLQKQLPDTALDHAATIIAAAFPGPSENAICALASQRLGVSENTIRAILRKETRNPSFVLIWASLQYIRDPWGLPGIREFVASVMGGRNE